MFDKPPEINFKESLTNLRIILECSKGPLKHLKREILTKLDLFGMLNYMGSIVK